MSANVTSRRCHVTKFLPVIQQFTYFKNHLYIQSTRKFVTSCNNVHQKWQAAICSLIAVVRPAVHGLIALTFQHYELGLSHAKLFFTEIFSHKNVESTPSKRWPQSRPKNSSLQNQHNAVARRSVNHASEIFGLVTPTVLGMETRINARVHGRDWL